MHLKAWHGADKELALTNICKFSTSVQRQKWPSAILFYQKSHRILLIDCPKAFSRKIQASMGLLILILVQFAFYARVLINVKPAFSTQHSSPRLDYKINKNVHWQLGWGVVKNGKRNKER